ncbi:MAG TPA: glycosyltransferase [Solirubrobacteraceae bacterium]
MSDLPLVSCIVITHQFERFVGRALDSVFAQEWPEERLDVVVIDDGSTDRTPEIVARYGDRVNYVRKPNEGLMPSVNRGLAEARGDYLTFVSGDDEVCPERIRAQLDVLAARPEVGLVYGDMEVIDDESKLLHVSFARALKAQPQVGRVFGHLLTRNFVSGGAAMVRGSLKSRFWPAPPEVAWEDWWMALKVAEVAELAYLDAPIYRYRLHGNNMNFGVQGERYLKLLQTELPFRRWLLRGGGIDHSAAGIGWQRGALVTLDQDAMKVATVTGLWLDELLEVSEDDRLAADAALAAGDPLTAAGHDPGHLGARAALEIPEAVPIALATRGDVTLALVDELVARPELLERYLAEVGPDDDATLVIYAPGRDEHAALAQLGPAVQALSSASAPDVLLHATRRTWRGERALLGAARALLTAEPRPALGLPSF